MMEQLLFNVLAEVYFISKGYRHAFVPFEILYRNLACENQKEKEDIDNCCRFLRNDGLLVSKGFPTISITHNGIKEVETMILEPNIRTLHFAAYLGIEM